MHVDCDDGHLSGIMEAMNYHAQEDNYSNFGLDYPYAPFMIVRTLHINKEYRRMGLGKSIIQFAHEYIGSLFNLNLNFITWEVAYYDKTTDGEKFTQADYDANIAFSIAIGGHVFSKYESSRFFFYNSDESLAEDLLVKKGLLPITATKEMAEKYLEYLKNIDYPVQDLLKGKS